MTTATDNFNRTAEVPLGAPWTSAVGGGCNSNGSAAVSTGGVDKFSFYSGSFGNDQTSEGTAGALVSGTAYSGVCVRMATTGGGRGYTFYTDGSSGAGHTEIARIDAGAPVVLLSISQTFANGDALKLGIVGTTLTAYKNGTSIGTIGDATYSSGGNPGIECFGTATVDNWTGSDGAGGGPPPMAFMTSDLYF